MTQTLLLQRILSLTPTCGKHGLELTAVLFVHGKFAKVHVAGNIVVYPGGISDSAILVEPQRGWSGVVGGHPQCFGLINEHIWHPELGSFVRVEREI